MVSKSKISKKSKSKKTLKKPVKIIKPKKSKKILNKPKTKKSVKTVKSKKIVSKSKSSFSKSKERKLVEDLNNPTHVKRFLESEYSTHKYEFTNNFFRDLFSLNGYFKFVWFPVLILLFVDLTTVLVKALIFNVIPAIVIYNSMYSAEYFLLSLFLISISFLVYFAFAYEAVKHNFRFSRVFPIILKFSLIFIIWDFALILLEYFTFLKSYFLLFNLTSNPTYLLTSFIWLIIKYVLLVLASVIVFFSFKRLKKH